jgi:predicted RNase H-like HicB family nuclease
MLTVMPELLRLHVLYRPVEGGWVQASLPALPGVATAGPTREQARDELLDAFREYLLSLNEGEPTVDGPAGETLVLSGEITGRLAPVPGS